MAGISHLKAFGRLFYPVTCATCGDALVDNEESICTTCRISLPYTSYHLNNDNELSKIFTGRMPVDFISAFLYYDKGISTQRILQSIKYKGNHKLAHTLGFWYAYDLKQCLPVQPDIIVPVPLHKRKLKERGFNQSDYWAEGLANGLSAEVNVNGLQRVRYTSTQTKKSRTERQDNVAKAFKVANPHLLKDKSVMLVDDVITTGATLEACGKELWDSGIRSLCVVTIAFAALQM